MPHYTLCRSKIFQSLILHVTLASLFYYKKGVQIGKFLQNQLQPIQ